MDDSYKAAADAKNRRLPRLRRWPILLLFVVILLGDIHGSASGSDASLRASASKRLADDHEALKLAQEFPRQERRLAPPPQKLILDPKLATTPVPDLTGMSSQAAEATLKRSGLVLGDTQRRESEQPAGTVMDQTPKAGSRVVRGSRVNIGLAQPASTVSVPDLGGMTRRSAEETLKDNRLGARYAGDQESDQRAGTVTSQNPQPGARIRPRTVVEFRLAKPFPMVRVPDLKRLARGQAARELETTGLRLGSIARRESDQPADTVIDQKPDAGILVRPGSQVDILIAQTAVVAVPDLSGMTRRGAEEALKDNRLGGRYAGDQESDQRAGTVTSQNPRAGTRVPPRTVVEFRLARPFPIAIVPDVIGLRRDQAERVLKDSTFNARYSGERESDRPAGTVVDQAPPAGAADKPGAVVQFWLAKPFLMVSVPDVKGMNRPDAERTLARNRLLPEHAGDKESDAPAGGVVDQIPLAGEAVEPDTPVKFWLAKPISLISVPNLIGMSHEEADAALRQPGLEPGGVEERESDRHPGTVLDQQPAGGELVKPGTRVDLALARAFPLVPVPDPIGMSHSDPAAIPALLQEAGLQLGAVALRDSDQPAETILEQDPAAGSLVERGAVVNLIVARLPAASHSPSFPIPRGALFVAGAALFLASATLALRKSARSKKSAPNAAVRARATKDVGRQEIFSKASPAIHLDIRLRSRLDKGSQTLAMRAASNRGGDKNG